jgi:SAM-dependent MidA family methyltransferase
MNTDAPLADRLAARMRAEGPISYAAFLDAALYDDHDGFYARHGSAGRRGDFITSPEVGPLFGAVLAHAIDDWWRDAGEPPLWRVVECGAGRGTLARAVLAARPDCLDALEYVLVERSDRLRTGHPDSAGCRSVAALPTDAAPGVVIANELLDNLAFAVRERHEGEWREVLVDVDADGAFIEMIGPPDDRPWPAADDGARLPVQEAAGDWLRDALRLAAPGRVVVIDYAATSAEMAARPWSDWVRTYRAHERGGHPLEGPGLQDVTVDVAVDQLAAVRPPTRDRAQADFLRAHGIDALVAEGRRVWDERAHLGDLAALRARSRVREADALLDPAGLGGFRVLEWAVD